MLGWIALHFWVWVFCKMIHVLAACLMWLPFLSPIANMTCFRMTSVWTSHVQSQYLLVQTLPAVTVSPTQQVNESEHEVSGEFHFPWLMPTTSFLLPACSHLLPFPPSRLAFSLSESLCVLCDPPSEYSPDQSSLSLSPLSPRAVLWHLYQREHK